jgi:ABC-2 type transport system permease protein
MMAAVAATLLPTLMLSGFIFPLNAMPDLIQYISYIVPAKYYLVIIRGIMLKGNTLFQLAGQTGFLLLLSLILLIIAVRKFSLNLEK